MDALIGWPGGDWQTTAKLAAAIVLSYLALIWFASVLWTLRDVRSRSRDPISQIVGISLVAFLPFVGLPIYLVLRPSETLHQAYDRQLEQDAMLAELRTVPACPSCRRPVQEDFVHCPYCRATVRAPCADCGKLLAHNWRHCPYCATSREAPRDAARLDFDSGVAEQAQPEPPSAEAASTEQAPAGEGAIVEAASEPVLHPARTRPRRPSATSEETAAC